MLELTLGTRLLILIIGLGLGFLCLIKTLMVRNLVGFMPWAEEHFSGGTYSLIKLWGIGLIIITLLIVFKG